MDASVCVCVCVWWGGGGGGREERGGRGKGGGGGSVWFSRSPLLLKILFSLEMFDFGDTVVTLNIHTSYSLPYASLQQHLITCECV